jgi:hypothetical protein
LTTVGSEHGKKLHVFRGGPFLKEKKKSVAHTAIRRGFFD